jgi:ribosomal protein L11 methyltransferase
VKVTEENSRLNNAADYLLTCASDGYQHTLIGEHAPYDLIVANILARPLVELAPDLARHLAPGGTAVLSGLLDRQEAGVIAAHEAQGLTFVKRYPQNGWHTLVLAK